MYASDLRPISQYAGLQTSIPCPQGKNNIVSTKHAVFFSEPHVASRRPETVMDFATFSHAFLCHSGS